MYNQFKKTLLLLPVALLLLVLPMTLRSAQLASFPVFGQVSEGDPTLTVTKTSSTSFSLAWTWGGLPEPTSYDITVTDLTTSTVVRSSSSSTKSATITGLTLTTGHTYEFAVKADGIIIIDIL